MRLDDPDFQEPRTAQTPFDSQEPYEALAKLMEEYDITQSEFVEYFMAASIKPEWSAEELGIPYSAVREICNLLDRVQIASSM